MFKKLLVDTTVLLSANEILYPNSIGVRDAESLDLFKWLITIKCNQIDIDHLFPDIYTSRNIPIVKVLKPFARKVAYDLLEEKLSDLYLKSAQEFIVYANDANYRLRDWLKMQLGDPRFESSFFDYNESSRKTSLKYANHILNGTPGYNELITHWKTLDVGNCQFAGRHHDGSTQMGTYNYLCAYAYFAFIKGPLYAVQSEHSDYEIKIDHWLLRDGIIKVFPEDSSEQRTTHPKSLIPSLFDWGSIIYEIFDRSRKEENASIEMLIELIEAVRESHSPEILRYGNSKEIAEWVVDTLFKANWKPSLTPHGKSTIEKFLNKAETIFDCWKITKPAAGLFKVVAIPLKWDLHLKEKARNDARNYKIGEPFKNVYANKIDESIHDWLRLRRSIFTQM